MTDTPPQAVLVSKLSKMATAGKSVEDMTAMYMREMSVGDLLDRDGEIDIGKRIEESERRLRASVLLYPKNIHTILSHFKATVDEAIKPELFAVDFYEPYNKDAAEAAADKNPEIKPPTPTLDFDKVTGAIKTAKTLFEQFNASISKNGVGGTDQRDYLNEVAEVLCDIEFHPNIVDELIYNVDAVQSGKVIGGIDGGLGLRDYERFLADIAINKCLMDRSDFIESFAGRESDFTWVDEQIQKGGKTAFYFNLAKDDFIGYQQKLKSIADRSLLTVPDIKANNRALTKNISRLRDVKNEMVEANLRLVVAFANKHSNYNNNFLDLVQEGNVGLMKAVERFDYRKGYKFSTYATWWIRQGVNRFLSDNIYTSRLPGHIVDARRTINKAGDEFYKEHGRQATLEEMTKVTGFSAQKIADIKEAVQHSSSLDAPIADGEGAGLIDFVEDAEMVTPESLMDSSNINDTLSAALDKLSPRENEIMCMRFGVNKERNYSAAEVSEVFNIPEQRVRDIETKALRKLRHPTVSENLKESLSAFNSPG